MFNTDTIVYVYIYIYIYIYIFIHLYHVGGKKVDTGGLTLMCNFLSIRVLLEFCRLLIL